MVTLHEVMQDVAEHFMRVPEAPTARLREGLATAIPSTRTLRDPDSLPLPVGVVIFLWHEVGFFVR